jgi:hypothetical protein
MQQDTLLKLPHWLTAVFGSGSTFEQFGAGSVTRGLFVPKQ